MQSEAKVNNVVSLLVYGTHLKTKARNIALSSTWQTLGSRDIDVSGAGGDDEDVVVNLLDLSPNVFDPDDPTKRPLGTFITRRIRQSIHSHSLTHSFVYIWLTMVDDYCNRLVDDS